MNTVLLRSEQTAGALSVIELSSPAGAAGPHLHRHDFDETFYVLEGELTFQLGEELFTRRAGELAFAPRNVAHTYANHSEAPARALLVCTPAGFERYFARLTAEREGVDPPDWALQPIPEVVRVGPQIPVARP
jgi:quercetin dioxygenase-like cupin family protein